MQNAPMPEEMNLLEFLAPLFRYWWIVALIMIAGAGAAIGAAYQKPQEYVSNALVIVNPEHIDPLAVAGILGNNQRLRAKVVGDKLVEVELVRGYEEPLKGELEAILAHGEEQARAMIPNYAQEYQGVMGRIQDTLVLVNGSTSPEERMLLSAPLGTLIERMYKLQNLASTSPQAFIVAQAPSSPVANGPRVPMTGFLVAVLIAGFVGCATAWLLHYSKVYRQAQGSLSQP